MGAFKEFYLNESKNPNVKIKTFKDSDVWYLTVAWIKGAKSKLHEGEFLYLSRKGIKDSDMIGFAQISIRNGIAQTMMVRVDEKYRRQGIASDIYDNFEKTMELKITPSNNKTTLGQKFSDSRNK